LSANPNANGRLQRALSACEALEPVAPGDQDTLFACTLAACELHDEKKAADYFSRLEESGLKRDVLQVCRRNGMRIGASTLDGSVERSPEFEAVHRSAKDPPFQQRRRGWRRRCK